MRTWNVSLAGLTACLATTWLPHSVSAASGIENLSALEVARRLDRAFVEVSRRVSPSVVVVQVAHRKDYSGSFEQNHPFWDQLPPELRKHFEEQFKEEREREPPRPSEREPLYTSQGSGIVIREDGYIMTNRHVVEGAEKIKVRFKDGSEYPAAIQGEDAQSDIAVVKIQASGLSPARLGDSARIEVGQFAIAIGAPYDLDYSVTFGHISAIGRSQLIRDVTMDQNFIQTDANINPGNSGGPLVNIEGEVIGINTLIRGLRSGIGFAIPINLAQEVADKLISEGKYVRAWLGIGILALRNHKEYRDLVKDVQDGVVVTMIRKDGPAYESELQPNDIILAVDGQSVKTEVQLKAAVRAKPIGQEVSLQVHRLDEDLQGRNIDINVKVAAWPEELFPVAVVRQPLNVDPIFSLGLRVELLTKKVAERFGVEQISGVMVTEVIGGSPAETKGIRPGDIITEVNQTAVATPKQLRETLKEADLDKGVIVNFTSRGLSKFEVIRKSDKED